MAHADIALRNVLMEGYDRICLIDFGVAILTAR